jgi:non-specific serine/threonine protein kinase
MAAPLLKKDVRMGQSEPCLSESDGWEVDLALRELRVRGVPVTIGSRPFEIIELLARSAGELVTKDDLMKRVWPGAVVEDNTIQVHISAIRKALGSDRNILKTLSGRGYRLMGSWTIREKDTSTRGDASGPRREGVHPFSSNVPIAASALVGRENIVQHLCNLVSAYRVVTLTGPGGIGKTVLAAAVTRRIFPTFEGDAWFVELASLSDPELVPSAVASTLGLQLGGGGITPGLVADAIGSKKVLLVLDNCEHVVDATANFVEILVRACSRCIILPTSREVLRVDGECVYRVPPLEAPAEDDEDPASILSRSAVELFVTRAKARDSDFSPHTDDLPATSSICRRLDGIPLAIEFAAARAAALGIQQVATDLSDRFALLTGGRRTALPRHQTLRAVLNWSYELLPEREQRLLRCLSIFPAGFTLDAAVAIMGEGIDAPTVTDGIANLVFKSLVSLSQSETVPRWRLLETTRVYAFGKLEESGEAGQTARRHAEFYCAVFALFATENQLQAAIDDLGAYRREIDNFRAALNWAFSADGDAAIGVALAAAGADFLVAVSLVAESCEWSGKALERIGGAAGTRSEMILQCNLGMSLTYTRGMGEDACKALTRGLSLAQTLADSDYLQRTTFGLWVFSARGSALYDALAVARSYENTVPLGDRHSRAVANWLVGIPLIYLGEHIEASTRLLQAINQYPIGNRHQDTIRFGADLRASASGHVSVSLLSRGLVDTALQAAMRAVEEAHTGNQPTVLCVALIFAAGFICLSLGELDLAERYGEDLIVLAQKHALRPYYAAGLCVRGSLAVRRTDPHAGVDLLSRGLADIRAASYLQFYPFFQIELAAALGALDRVDDGLSEIDTALHFAADTGHRWFLPETLRVKGELLARRGSDDPGVIADLFRHSISEAHQQQALYWELSAAISLADLMRSQNRDVEAQAVLGPVYDRFTEGFSTISLKRAKSILGGTRSDRREWR